MDKIKHPGLIGFAVFVSFLASACNIGAFASPYWYYESTNGGTGYGGFWQACIEMSGSKTCSSIKPWEEGKEWYDKTTPGLIVGAALLTFIGFIAISIKSCKGSNAGCESAYCLSGILFLLGALMIGGALFVWARYTPEVYQDNKGYSFYVDCAGGGLFLVAAILIALPIYKESQVSPSNY